MNETVVVQEREITNKEIGLIQQLIAANPSWNRPRLSKELCVLWNWRAANGQIKDMACRTFLWKLEQRGYLTLPPSQKSPGKAICRRVLPYGTYQTTVLTSNLSTLVPVQIELVEERPGSSETLQVPACPVSLSGVERHRRRKHEIPGL